MNSTILYIVVQMTSAQLTVLFITFLKKAIPIQLLNEKKLAGYHTDYVFQQKILVPNILLDSG